MPEVVLEMRQEMGVAIEPEPELQTELESENPFDLEPENRDIPQKDSDASAVRKHNIELGKKGEDAAVMFLERNDFQILDRNWKCAAGEADIVATDDTHLHFIEVKTRMGDGKGFPEESVDKKKRKRYESIAELYLRDYDGEDIGITFDIIAIKVLNDSRAMLRFYRNVLAYDCR